MSDTTEADDLQAQADFDVGTGETATGKAAKVIEAAAETRAEEQPPPDLAQVTRKDLEELRSAAGKMASYEQQISRAFGAVGHLTKLVNALQAQTPRGGKVEISDEDFADLAKDFPELATSTRAALTKVLSKLSGTGPAEVDDATLSRKLTETIEARELKDLEEDVPNWRTVVGAVAPDQSPDPNHPFRAWLATKDQAYQAQINGTTRPTVISRAIERFQSETKPTTVAKTADPKAQQRTDRIRDAVQPKGDRGPPAPSKTDDDEFEAGFKTG